MLTAGVTVGLAEGIIDDTCLVLSYIKLTESFVSTNTAHADL